jgi:hypothetical protein
MLTTRISATNSTIKNESLLSLFMNVVLNLLCLHGKGPISSSPRLESRLADSISSRSCYLLIGTRFRLASERLGQATDKTDCSTPVRNNCSCRRRPSGIQPRLLVGKKRCYAPVGNDLYSFFLNPLVGISPAAETGNPQLEYHAHGRYTLLQDSALLLALSHDNCHDPIMTLSYLE